MFTEAFYALVDRVLAEYDESGLDEFHPDTTHNPIPPSHIRSAAGSLPGLPVRVG